MHRILHNRAAGSHAKSQSQGTWHGQNLLFHAEACNSFSALSTPSEGQPHTKQCSKSGSAVSFRCLRSSNSPSTTRYRSCFDSLFASTSRTSLIHPRPHLTLPPVQLVCSPTAPSSDCHPAEHQGDFAPLSCPSVSPPSTRCDRRC